MHTRWQAIWGDIKKTKKKSNKCNQCDFALTINTQLNPIWTNPETTLMAPFLTETFVSQPRTIPKITCDRLVQE